MTSLWWTTRREQETKSTEKRTAYPRTMIMYITGSNQLKQSKILNQQLKNKTGRTERSTYITYDQVPSPGRYNEKRPRSHSTAYLAQAKRKIQLSSQDLSVPGPGQYKPGRVDEMGKIQHTIYALPRVAEQGPKKTLKQADGQVEEVKQESDLNPRYSHIYKDPKGTCFPKAGLGRGPVRPDSAVFLGPAAYNIKYSQLGRPSARAASARVK